MRGSALTRPPPGAFGKHFRLPPAELYSPWARYLAALDVPDCGCPFRGRPCLCGSVDCATHPPVYPPPCSHVLAAGQKALALGLILDVWARMLRAHDPHEYAEPPLPALPAPDLSRDCRMQVYRERDSIGSSIYHPADLCRRMPDTLAIQGGRGRVERGLCAGEYVPPRTRRTVAETWFDPEAGAADVLAVWRARRGESGMTEEREVQAADLPAGLRRVLEAEADTRERSRQDDADARKGRLDQAERVLRRARRVLSGLGGEAASALAALADVLAEVEELRAG